MSDLLKTVIQDLINDRPEQASAALHTYLVGKTQQVTGLGEAKSAAPKQTLAQQLLTVEKDEQPDVPLRKKL